MENQEKNQFYTDFITKQEFLNLLRSASAQYIESFSGRVNTKNDVMPVTMSDGFVYIDCIASNNKWPDIIRKIFLQCWSQAENRINSSGVIATYFLATKFVEKEKKSINEFSRNIIPATKSAGFKSLSQILESEIFDFIKNVIELAGINGSISVRKTASALPAIELSAGHNFQTGMCNQFISDKETRDETKIILFDGIIESIGEVDSIFTLCNEKKISCIIVARGFANDVISTINKNYLRKTLDIIPIKIDDKIEHINLINDMGICSNFNVINAESGVRLSNVNIEDQPTITNVVATKTRFSFSSKPEAKLNVSKRIEKIKDRIEHAHWDEEMSAEDIQKVFVSRLDSLSTNSIILWTPGDDRQQSFIKNRFLFSLNYMAAFANSGAIKTNKVILTCDNLPEFLPANIVDLSESLSKKIYSAISNSGGCVAIQ